MLAKLMWTQGWTGGSWAIGGAALLLGVGCDLAAGYQDLGNSLVTPDAALLDRPGRQLASGQYSMLSVDGSFDDGGRVLALRHDLEEQSLAIVPFLEGEEACTVGPADDFRRLASRIDLELGALVAVQSGRSSDKYGKVRFVNFECEDVLEPLEDAQMPSVPFPALDPSGLVTLTKTGDLYLVDARNVELVYIASDVVWTEVSDGRIWTLENGKLVVRDDELAELATLGDAVTEFFVSGSEVHEVYYVDDNILYSWSKDEEPKKIQTDVCHLRSASSSAVSYFSPCDQRQAQFLIDAESLGFSGDSVRIVGPKNVLGSASLDMHFGFQSNLTRITFAVGDDPEMIAGPLFSLISDPEATLPDSRVLTPEPLDLGADGIFLGGQLYSLNFDGVTGDVAELELDESGIPTGFRIAVPGVAALLGDTPYSDAGLIDAFDVSTGVGSLSLFEDNGGKAPTRTVLADGVPLQGITTDTENGDHAFLGNWDGDLGEVFLLRDRKAKAVAKDAFLGTLRFLEEPRAVAFLGKTERSSGAQLHAYLVEPGLDVTIADGVNEYRSLPWPSPGILYSVWEGESRGLWLSKAR